MAWVPDSQQRDEQVGEDSEHDDAPNGMVLEHLLLFESKSPAIVVLHRPKVLFNGKAACKTSPTLLL